MFCPVSHGSDLATETGFHWTYWHLTDTGALTAWQTEPSKVVMEISFTWQK